MKNLTPVIFLVIACNQIVLSRRLRNAIDDNLYYEEFAKPYSINNGAAPYRGWGLADDDAYSDENEHSWSDEIPSRTAQGKIQQCITTCQPNSAYQPVCATDGVTYHNLEHLQCFMRCGVVVHIRQLSPCPGWSGTTASPTQLPQTTTAASTTTSNNLQACMLLCPTTPEYNPVCGTDRVTYDNPGKLACAQWCGKDVQVSRRSPCPKIKSTVEPVSTTTTPKSIQIRICMTSCPTDPQYDPVCGTNKETFYNLSRLQCAINCGLDVSLLKSVPCHIEENSDTDGSKENDEDEDFEIDIRNQHTRRAF
ncbi:serine protease inhibitor dipetalogastin-like isoform X2 [Maniola jurtina]|uniref:serine protease inhibitor dipetalogastin-like isoform X2 n=1 Tax=Maniola jurtina TaxID=191418 RepID=UPI001E68CDEF|nr:serine protease inhibitor dipetalogastin-like isoform X2 [Maniola jurtina]